MRQIALVERCLNPPTVENEANADTDVGVTRTSGETLNRSLLTINGVSYKAMFHRKSILGALVTVLGVSLFQIFVHVEALGTTTSISLANMTVLIVLVVLLMRGGKIIPSPMVVAAVLLAAAVLLSGLWNAWSDSTFVTFNFATNYVRVIGLVGMVLLLPAWLRRLGHGRLVVATLWAMRIHSILILVDSVTPLRWSPTWYGFERPTSTFGEPSFFAVYMLLSLLFVLQVQKNTRISYLRVYDIALFSLALITSAAVSSIIALGLFLIALTWRRARVPSRKVVMGLAAMVLLTSTLVGLTSNFGPGKNWEYVTSRVYQAQPLRLEDSSAKRRIFGGRLFVMNVVLDAPLLGRGVGGVNTERLYREYGGDEAGIDNPLSVTTMPAAVVGGVGLIGLLIFAFILAWSLTSAETRLMGISLVSVAFLWGGAFDVMLWWYISLAISLKTARGKAATKSGPGYGTKTTSSAAKSS